MSRRSASPMENHLPDEILSEILSPALKVPDEMFADNWSRPSPFATYTESTSAYLVVSKSWLRVATPLLYHVVVLRSAAQAKALARALLKNKELGRFIKKLRVEGGFGASMHQILRLAPTITDIFLSLDIYCTDNTDGLCKGLPLINPRRLILQHDNYRQNPNKYFNGLNAKLKELFGSQWDQLISIALPSMGYLNKITPLVKALNKPKRIEILTLYNCFCLNSAIKMLDKCPIREINLTSPVRDRDIDRYVEDTSLKSKLKYSPLPNTGGPLDQNPGLPDSLPSLNPFFVPMVGVSAEVSDSIWSRILQFSMSTHPGYSPPWSRKMSHKLSLLLVSKQFYRLGLPHFYTSVVLRYVREYVSFADVLTSHPSLGAHVSSICPRRDHSNIDYASMYDSDDSEDSEIFDMAHIFSRHGPVREKPSDAAIATALTTIFSQTPNLVSIQSHSSTERTMYMGGDIMRLDWATFATIAECSGSNLQQISIAVNNEPAEVGNALDIFGKLTAVKKLRWDSTIVLNPTENVADYAGVLPQLEKLEVEIADPSFFHLLSRIQPPNLRCLVLRPELRLTSSKLFTQFNWTEISLSAQAAGDLKSSVLDVCTDLETLTITWPRWLSTPEPPSLTIFASEKPAKSLKKVVFASAPDAFRYDKKLVPEWSTFLAQLPLDSMPNLTEISMPGVEWPMTQREIAKCGWINAAETLVKSGVQVVDAAGKKWKPRLKVR
ncbi:hypothetical protein MIND_00312100 [Mycena indigotica]|uniref:Uncharacterized protein n=1 Tax=Mycena indigotica TaxID=2126181 RepID=A0A8H6T1R8_9AGAR|nr:uncharacterized protein MIND_00312100 [Mycena indigotica]KAF7309413.1 hypothetical protein MIND_00312100 [Mycena indigotica]